MVTYRNSSDIVHSGIVHHVLPVRDNRQIAIAVLPSKRMKGCLRGEERCIRLKVEVVNKRRSLSFHCDGDDYVGDHFEIIFVLVTMRGGQP